MIEKNTPALWRKNIPSKTNEQNKYDHGWAVVIGAPELTGATRLATTSCARSGVGLVSIIASDSQSAQIYRTTLPAHIMVQTELHDHTISKATAFLIGSGGVPENHQVKNFIQNNSSLPIIYDADALRPDLRELDHPAILTPHEGEFKRCFPHINGTREERALQAAKHANACIVLKGHQTLIADPSGRIIRNENASPWLATAGTGDVLAGLITGLVARKMSLTDAASAAVWIHGQASQHAGPYMAASDLEAQITKVLTELI